MLAFIGYTLAFIGLLLVFAAPTLYLSHRKGRPATIKRFLIAAAGCGLLAGMVLGTGRQLENQCLEQGNSNCYDAGGNGLIFMVFVGFLGASLLKARSLAHR